MYQADMSCSRVSGTELAVLSPHCLKNYESAPFPDLTLKVGRNATGALVVLYGRQENNSVLAHVTAGISRSMAGCICIRMSSGSFAEYSHSSMLHAGLSDSHGRVHHFDETGHHVDEYWPESICVPLFAALRDPDSCAGRLWDSALASFHDVHSRTGRQYDPVCHNCYTYIVEFLRNTQFRGHRDHTLETVEEMITEPVDRALHYLELLRHALRDTAPAEGVSWLRPYFDQGGGLAY
jgi:hypothetical protein